jgi:uncharacterized protein YdeI (YjbR/CyaY-like superfamily)
METKDGKQAVYMPTRLEWRNWLEQNSQCEKNVWLILYHKKSEVQCVNLIEATEEALCFGWIDSLAKNVMQKVITSLLPRAIRKKVNGVNQIRKERKE